MVHRPADVTVNQSSLTSLKSIWKGHALHDVFKTKLLSQYIGSVCYAINNYIQVQNIPRTCPAERVS